MESVGKNVADVEGFHKILNEDKSVKESVSDEWEVYMSQPKAQLRSHDTQSTMAETETRTGTFAKAERCHHRRPQRCVYVETVWKRILTSGWTTKAVQTMLMNIVSSDIVKAMRELLTQGTSTITTRLNRLSTMRSAPARWRETRKNRSITTTRRMTWSTRRFGSDWRVAGR